MKEDFCLLIIYSDGSTKIVENVENYGFKHESGLFYFTKNDFNGFIPREHVKFIGKLFDYDSIDG